VLINCAAYKQGHKLADITIEEISDYLSQAGVMVWVALKDPSEAELLLMQEEFALHDLAIEDAKKGYQRPKTEEYGDVVFSVAHLLEMHEDKISAGELHIFTGPNFLLSIRRSSSQSFSSVRDRCEQEPHLFKYGPAYVLYAMIDTVVDGYFDILAQLELSLESIEAEIFSVNTGRSNIEKLYELKRQVSTLKHATAPLLEAFAKFNGGRVPAIGVNMEEYFRDLTDHLTRINVSVDQIRESILMAVEVNLSMVTIEDGEVTKRLAAWAGIFAVATAFAGIWGMNFEAMPELKWSYGYPVALSIIIISCVYLYRRFKKSGWL
jgi:magnesium transporter